MLNWTRDEAYSGEETARLGDFAAVIVPPEITGEETWGIQIFDEADDEAMEYGETYTRVEGLPGRAIAKIIAETILDKYAAARNF